MNCAAFGSVSSLFDIMVPMLFSDFLFVLPRDGVSVGEFRMDFEGVAGASSRWIGTECMTVGWLVGCYVAHYCWLQ